MQPALSVTTSTELAHALERLGGQDFIALDTEFLRESTYFPKLCLIQAATLECCVLIDPLTVHDLDPLWVFLAGRDRTKVLHAARQDLEVLGGALGERAPPGPIFDTQIAGALLGLPAQAGYAALVAARLGRTLQKDHTRTDWSRRPLSAEQLQYAADDVRYLAPLFIDLRDALSAAGRLEWLYEETRELEQPGLHRVDPQSAWKRLKGLERLQPAQRATAKLLAQWRETVAMTADKPRGWILSDEALRELSERLPSSAHELERIRGLPAGVVRRRGQELLELIERGRELASDEAATFTPPRPEPQQLARVTKMMAVVRAQAAELGISPELLATRRDVEQLVFSGRTRRLMNGWRRSIIGERLVDLAGV